jgi:hypothetical protein
VWRGTTQLSGTDGAITPFTSLLRLLERKQIKRSAFTTFLREEIGVEL